MRAAGRRRARRTRRIPMRAFLLGLVAAVALPASASGATWQPVQTLSGAGAQALEAQVAFDSQGGALAIWHRSGVIQTRFRPRGGSFGPAQSLSPAGVASLRGQIA